jgi:hypothetical protein
MSRRRNLIVAVEDGLVVKRDPDRPSGRQLIQYDMDASYVDLADEAHLEFEYLRWIRILLRAFRARRVIHVGGAGCTLPRALLSEDHGSRHEVIEIDGHLLEFARAHLGLRTQPGLKLRVADGRAAVGEHPDESADAIVIDAFVGARVPRHLVTVEALTDCARVAPTTIINVVDSAGWPHTRAIAAGLAEAYPHVGGLCGSRRAGNIVLFASREQPDGRRIETAAAADRYAARLLARSDLSGGGIWRDRL